MLERVQELLRGRARPTASVRGPAIDPAVVLRSALAPGADARDAERWRALWLPTWQPRTEELRRTASAAVLDWLEAGGLR